MSLEDKWSKDSFPSQEINFSSSQTIDLDSSIQDISNRNNSIIQESSILKELSPIEDVDNLFVNSIVNDNQSNSSPVDQNLNGDTKLQKLSRQNSLYKQSFSKMQLESLKNDSENKDIFNETTDFSSGGILSSLDATGDFGSTAANLGSTTDDFGFQNSFMFSNTFSSPYNDNLYGDSNAYDNMDSTGGLYSTYGSYGMPTFSIDVPSDGDEADEMEQEFLKYKEMQKDHEASLNVEDNYEDLLTPENDTIFDFQNASGVFEEHNLAAISSVNKSSSVVENIVTAEDIQFSEKIDFPDDYIFELDLGLINQKNESEIRRALDIIPMIIKISFSLPMMKAIGDAKMLHIINLTQILLEIRHQEYYAEKEERIYISQKVEEYINRRKDPEQDNSPKNDASRNQELFKRFDKTKKGYLTAKELKNSLNEVGVSLTDDQINHLFSQINLKNKDIIDIYEFQELMDLLDGDSDDPMKVQKELEEKYKAQISKMEEQIVQLGREKFDFESQFTLLKRRFDEVKTELDENNNKYLPMEENFRNLEKERNDLLKEAEFLRKENILLEERFNEEIRSHNKTKESSTKIIEKLEASITQFEAGTGEKIERLDHKYRITELENEVKDLNDKLLHLRQSYDLMEERTSNEINYLTKENEEMSIEIDSNRINISKLEDDVRYYQIEMSKQEEKINLYDNERDQLQMDIRGLSSQKLSLELELESAHQIIENNPFKDRLQTTEEAYKLEIENINKRNADNQLEYETQILKLKKQIENPTITKIEQIPQSIIDEIQAPLNKKIKSLNKTIDAFEMTVQKIENEQKESNDYRSLVEAENDMFKKQIQELNTDKSLLQTNINTLENTIKQLKDKTIEESNHKSKQIDINHTLIQTDPVTTSEISQQSNNHTNNVIIDPERVKELTNKINKYKLKVLKLENRIEELEENSGSTNNMDTEINLIYEETKRLQSIQEAEKDKLEQIRADLEAKRKNLENEFKAEMLAQKQEIISYKEKSSSLEKALQKQKDNYEAQTNQLKEIHQQELLKLEADLILERNELNHKIQELEESVESKVIASTVSTELNVKSQMNSMKEKYKNKILTLKKMLQDLQNIQSSQNTKEVEIENLKLKFKKLKLHYEKEINILKHALNEIQDENIWLHNELNTSTNQKELLSANINILPSIIDLFNNLLKNHDLTIEEKNLEYHKNQMKIKSDEHIFEMKKLSKNLDQQSNIATKYKHMVLDLEKKIDEFSLQNNDYKFQLQNLVLELRNKNHLIKSLTQQVTTLNTKFIHSSEKENQLATSEKVNTVVKSPPKTENPTQIQPRYSTASSEQSDDGMLFHILTPSDLVDSKIRKAKKKRPSSATNHKDSIVIRSAFHQTIKTKSNTKKSESKQRVWVIPYCWIHSTAYTLLVRKRDERWSCFEEQVRIKELMADSLFVASKIVARNTFGLLHDPSNISEESIDESISTLYNDFQEFQQKKRTHNSILKIEIQNTITKNTDLCYFVPIPYARVEILHERMSTSLSQQMIQESGIYQFAWVKLSILTSVVQKSLSHIESEDINILHLLEWKEGEILSPKFARILARGLESIETLYKVEQIQEGRGSISSISRTGTPTPLGTSRSVTPELVARKTRSRPQSAMALRG